MTNPNEFERFKVVRQSDGAVVLDGTWPQVAAGLPDSRASRQKQQVINDTAQSLRRVIRDSGKALRKAQNQRRADDADADHALNEMGRRVHELEMQQAKWMPILQQFQAAQQANDALNAEPFPGGPDDPSKEPEPALELEDDADPKAPLEPTRETDARGEFLRIPLGKSRMTDEGEFPMGETPSPPQVSQPIAVGFDDE